MQAVDERILAFVALQESALLPPRMGVVSGIGLDESATLVRTMSSFSAIAPVGVDADRAAMLVQSLNVHP